MGDRPIKYPGYTALLPPRVRYDREVPVTAKLLYAEVTAMTDVTGFCWATNGYLGALIGVSKDRAARLVALLEERGYLQTEVIRDERNTVVERRIFVTDLGLMRLPPPVKNTGRGPVKNTRSPPGKNTGTTMNDKNNNIPPYSPPKGGRARVDHKRAPDWKPEDFARIWEWYPTGQISMHPRRGNKQKAIRAWDKLHPDDALIRTMEEALSRQAACAPWSEGVGIPHLSTYLNNYGWEGWETGEAGPEPEAGGEELPLL